MQIQIYVSVTVLILIQKSVSKAVSRPSPPASVSIQCDSYGVEVRWKYSDLDQDVQFQVKVIHDYNERNSNITQNLTQSLHLNISSMLFYPAYNRYYVTVTAVRGGEESEPTLSDIFSYNKYATAKIKCYLDFPEVELSPKDGKLHVQFTNPLQLYRNSPALRGLTDNLKYFIETEGRNEACETCEMKQNTCEASVVFSEYRGEYCINLTGKIGQRFFNLRSSCFTGDIRNSVSRPSPPASVSIQCDSYGVEVRWEYPDLDQDVQFQVKVIHDYNERTSNITQNLTQSRRLNISNMLFNPEYNRYYVTVTAVRGGEESEPTLSDIFSYNKYVPAKIKCYLDFPEVELSPKDGKLHVQFTNPLQLYRNSPALRGLTDNLKYFIETEGKNKTSETCEMKQNTCETSIVFSEYRGEYCVNLTGKIGQRFFNLRSSCFTGDIRNYPPVTVYVYPVLGVVLTLLFITGIIMLLVSMCNSEMKKKVHLMFQYFTDFSTQPAEECRTLRVEPEAYSVVKIEQSENTKEQDPFLEMSDDELPSSTKGLGSGELEVKSPYGPNDLVGSEQSNLSDFYDCPHAPGKE
uniref:Fibronectin type-III domain-containing protein n=1 Tax=Cyprinus carpio TaxID=7962 RepID=A0A8C1R6H2_CYPCA